MPWLPVLTCSAFVGKAVWRALKRPGQAIYLRSFGLFDPAQFIIPPLLVKMR
jgi:hypothetical protein